MNDFLSQFPNSFSFYQLMGWIAVCFYVASFQFLNPRKTIMLWIPANGIMSVHYFGLGSYTACSLAIGAIFRDTAAAFGPKKIMLGVVIIYTVYIWVMAVFLSLNLHDYLITIGTSFTALAAISRDHFWWHRIFAFTQQFFLLCGFVLMGSYPGVANIILVMGSNMIGMIRKGR